MNRQLITIVIITTALSGCATMEQSMLLGAGTVGVVGTGFGAAAGNSTGSALIGLGIGAVIGGTMGYLVHKDKEEKEHQLKSTSKKEEGDKTPSLSQPEVRRVWVPDKADGERLESGHWLWVIEKPAHFIH